MPLHGGHSTVATPRGLLHGVADLVYTDIRSIMMVLLAFKGEIHDTAGAKVLQRLDLLINYDGK